VQLQRQSFVWAQHFTSECNLFLQDLVLPASKYCLHIVYKANLDYSYGKAVSGNFGCHPILVNGTRYEINLSEDEDSGEYRGTLRFIHRGGAIRLETRVQDTPCFNATLLEIDCDDSAFPCTNLYAPDNDGNAEVTVVRGIPFLSAHHATPINMWGYGKYRNTSELPEPEGQLADWSKGSISCAMHRLIRFIASECPIAMILPTVHGITPPMISECTILSETASAVWS